MTGNRGNTPPSSAVVTVDRAFRVRGWPDHAAAMFGWSSAEACGQELFTLLGVIEPAGQEPLRAWRACCHRCEPRRADGATVAVEMRFEPLPPPDDAVALLWFAAAAADAAREVEARYESVVTAMQEGVVVLAPDGHVVSCNPAAVRILGLSEAELLGRTTRDPRWRFVHEDGSPFAAEEYPAAITLRTGGDQRGVLMGVHRPDGSFAWVSSNTAPVRLHPEGPLHAVVATFVDVTDARLSAERVKRLAGLLPVCAWCKSIRNDQGYWQQLEHYLAEHTDARFTHGLCPTCSSKLAGGSPAG